MQDINRFDPAEQFIHFFLPVAGCLPDNQIRKIGVGTLVRNSKTIAGLDQGTHVLRQMRFCCPDRFLAHPAETDRTESGCIQNLFRRKGAENPGNQSALFLDRFDSQKTVLSSGTKS